MSSRFVIPSISANPVSTRTHSSPSRLSRPVRILRFWHTPSLVKPGDFPQQIRAECRIRLLTRHRIRTKGRDRKRIMHEVQHEVLTVSMSSPGLTAPVPPLDPILAIESPCRVMIQTHHVSLSLDFVFVVG